MLRRARNTTQPGNFLLSIQTGFPVLMDGNLQQIQFDTRTSNLKFTIHFVNSKLNDSVSRVLSYFFPYVFLSDNVLTSAATLCISAPCRD